MTTFDPQFSSSDPNYLGWSKSADTPKADQSLEIGLKAAGDIFDGGVEIADNAIKATIKDNLSKSLDSERQQFTDALTAVRGTAGKGNPADAMAGASDQDLMPDKGPAAPTPVSNGIQSVSNLQAAYAGNKLSETQYYSKLTAITKDMRSQWPGYRDYIDQEVSKITGGNPANEYIKSAINDINRSQTNAAKEQDYYEKAIINSGYDKADDVLKQFQQDHNLNYVQSWLAKNTTAQQAVKSKLTDFQLTNAQNGDDQTKAENGANAVADHAATAFFFNRNIVIDNNSSISASDISDQLLKMGSNPGSIDAERVRTLGTQLQSLEARSRIDTMQQLRNTKNSDGRSIYDVLGPKKANDIVDGTIGKLYGAQHQMLADANVGLLFSTQNAASDMVNNNTFKVLKDPSVGAVALTGATLNKLMPNLSPGFIENINGAYKGANGSSAVGAAGVASDLMKLAQQQKKQAVTQTGGSYAGNGGNIYTFKQFQDEQDRAQSVAGGTNQEKAAATKSFLGLRQGLLEKDPRVVDNAITTFFDPSNRGTLNKYADDYYDPTRKVIVTGRTGAFQDLTSPDITKAVWNRANNGNGTGWEFYKSWARGEAIPALTTIAKTWNQNETQLANQQTIHGTEGDMPSGTDHHFYWDTDKHQIGITDLKGSPMNIEDSWRLNPDIFAVRNANIMLRSLANIATTEGTNPEAFLFKTMKDAGWAPPSLDTKGTSTVSDRIIKAIVASQPPKGAQ